MPVASMNEILQPAFKERYGVAAFNIVNDLTMAAVLDAAAQTNSPVIVQVSVKTVKMFGAKLIQRMFEEMASHVDIPATLHLDHCPDVAMIKTCLDAGWNSVLFDASKLSYEDNLRQTKEVVAMARKVGAAVEGELEAVKGVEDDIGSDEEGGLVRLDKCVEFLEQTGVDAFAPAIGTAHGLYKSAPKINFARAREIVTAHPTPLVLHGGTRSHRRCLQTVDRGGLRQGQHLYYVEDQLLRRQSRVSECQARRARSFEVDGQRTRKTGTNGQGLHGDLWQRRQGSCRSGKPCLEHLSSIAMES